MSPNNQKRLWIVLEFTLLFYAIWTGTQPFWQSNFSEYFVLGSMFKATGFILLSLGPAVMWRRIARKSQNS